MTNHPLSHLYYADYADEMIHYVQSTSYPWVIASPIEVEIDADAA